MSQVTNHKVRTPHAVVFDTGQMIEFAPVTLVASQTSATVQSTKLFPTTYKILRAMAYFTAAAVAGTCSINIVAGTAAEAGVGIPDTLDNGVGAYPRVVAGAGIQLFAADQVVTMTANTTTQLDVPADLFDVIWKGPITLRTITNGAATGVLVVSLFVKPTDIIPWTPEGSGNDVNFTPARDLP